MTPPVARSKKTTKRPPKKAAKKSTKASKSRAKSRAPKAQRTPRHGRGKLNVGGTFPGAGRPPDEFKRTMQAIADDELAREYLLECVRGVHGPAAAMKAQEHVHERGYGKVPSVTRLESGDEPLTIRVVSE